MSVHRGDAERLFAATGIDLEQVQIIGVEGDPDVEALSRARVEAIKHQASAYLAFRSYQPVPNLSRTPLPVPIIVACDFCGDALHLHALRWKFVGVRTFRPLEVKAVIPLGGLACSTCYPLSRDEVNRVYAARVKRQAA